MSFGISAAAISAAIAEAAAAVGAGFTAALPAALGGTTGAIGAGTGIGAGTAAGAGAAAAAGAGGLTAGAGGIAGSIGAGLSGIVQGGLLGSALGAGTAALTGGDIGKGASMGAATGAVGGGLLAGAGEIGAGMGSAEGAGNLAPVTDEGGSTAAVTPARGVTISPANIPQTPLNPDIPISFEPTQIPMSSRELSSAIRQPIPTNAPSLGSGNYASNIEAINAVNNIPSAPLKASDYVDKGINFIKKNPAVAMQLGGAGLSMMSGNPNQQKAPASQAYPYSPSTYVPPAIQPTTVPQYYDPTGSYGYGTGYAEGGNVSSQQPNGQMNPIVARAMQQVQQAQQLQQPQQVVPQPRAPQGIAAIAPPTQIMPQAQPTQMAAGGGMMQDNLGGYSHGGIAGLTRGPGDGVSDSIPAEIGTSGKQPARLADGEFVIPARIVSELGNGSTEAGAKSLQAMVDRVQKRRSKTVGKGKVAVDSKARKGLIA